jgi:hypothetical protein
MLGARPILHINRIKFKRNKEHKWTDKITNKELWRITKQKPIEIQVKEENGIELDTH